MASKTTEKLIFLKTFIEKEFPKWKEHYGHNLLGVHIGYLETDGVYKQRYSIVFHVKKKYKKPSNFIPEEIEISIPKQGKKKIPTDIVEVGKFQLQSTHLGNKVKPLGKYNYGSVGFFAKRNGLFYLVSNMHVLGNKYVRRGDKSFYRHVTNQSRPDIKISNKNGAFLEHGFFEDIDAAIARIRPERISNHIPGFGRPRGYFIVNFNNLNVMRKKKYAMHGATSKTVNARLMEIGKVVAEKYYGNEIFLTDLIKITKCAIPGDSGASVFEPKSMTLLGMVVGSDDRFTYLIPIDKILNRFYAEFLY